MPVQRIARQFSSLPHSPEFDTIDDNFGIQPHDEHVRTKAIPFPITVICPLNDNSSRQISNLGTLIQYRWKWLGRWFETGLGLQFHPLIGHVLQNPPPARLQSTG